MLDALYKDSVTVRRPKGRDAANRITYEEILAENGGPLVIRCRIERRRRRVVTTDAKERVQDAQMVFRSDLAPQLQSQDIVVVTKDRETFEVDTLEKLDSPFGGPVAYGRAGLLRTAAVIPENEHDGQTVN